VKLKLKFIWLFFLYKSSTHPWPKIMFLMIRKLIMFHINSIQYRPFTQKSKIKLIWKLIPSIKITRQSSSDYNDLKLSPTKKSFKATFSNNKNQEWIDFQHVVLMSIFWSKLLFTVFRSLDVGGAGILLFRFNSIYFISMELSHEILLRKPVRY
jgi:hypothetical protein